MINLSELKFLNNLIKILFKLKIYENANQKVRWIGINQCEEISIYFIITPILMLFLLFKINSI